MQNSTSQGKAPLQNILAGYPTQTQLEKQKQIYDHKAHGSPLEPNTLVWLPLLFPEMVWNCTTRGQDLGECWSTFLMQHTEYSTWT